MRTYAANELRDIVLVGHGGSGKTTLADSILYATRTSQRFGRVDDDTSSFDFEPEEHKRKGSISAATGWVEWKKTRINLVDTSGHGNFLVDTQVAVRVADAALIVVSAADGVQVYTERTAQMAAERGIPRAVFVSKLDRERADFQATLDDVRKNLTDKAFAVQLPIGEAGGLSGVIDLVQRKALRFGSDGREVSAFEIPAALQPAAKAAREKLDEAVASADDALLDKYLEAGELTEEQFQSGYAKAVRSGALVPVLCGAPALGVGTLPLLDFLVAVFPSPAERPPTDGHLPAHGGASIGEAATRAPDPAAPFSAWVWKTVNSEIGKLSLVRVLSGKLLANHDVLSVNHDKREHVGQIYLLQGKGRDTVSEACPGDLVAIPKLKVTRTGDTLSDEKHPFMLERPALPPAMIKYAIHPKSKGDEDKLGRALTDLVEADPGLHVEHTGSKEILLGGSGQVHIEVAVEKLHRAGVDVDLLPPRIPYLETIKGVAKNVEGKHKKQTGGKGQYGVVFIDVGPIPRGKGFEFDDAVVGGTVPRQFIPAVEKGIRNRMARGVVAGFPVTDVRVRLLDGKYHDVDSDSRSFEIAGSKGFQAAFKLAKPILLEPVMQVEVACPEESMGAIVGDLNHRRGHVEGMEVRGGHRIVKAKVPMAETLRYEADLRSITGGRGSFTMELSHYAELPGHLSDKVIAEARVAHEEDD